MRRKRIRGLLLHLVTVSWHLPAQRIGLTLRCCGLLSPGSRSTLERTIVGNETLLQLSAPEVQSGSFQRINKYEIFCLSIKGSHVTRPGGIRRQGALLDICRIVPTWISLALFTLQHCSCFPPSVSASVAFSRMSTSLPRSQGLL